jgi:hypothetical protein
MSKHVLTLSPTACLLCTCTCYVAHATHYIPLHHIVAYAASSFAWRVVWECCSTCTTQGCMFVTGHIGPWAHVHTRKTLPAATNTSVFAHTCALYTAIAMRCWRLSSSHMCDTDGCRQTTVVAHAAAITAAACYRKPLRLNIRATIYRDAADQRQIGLAVGRTCCVKE